MLVRDLVSGRKEVYGVYEDQTVWEAIHYMVSKGVGAVAVFNREGKLAGIFSERDALKRVVLKERDLKTTLIKDVMTQRLVVVSMDAPLEKAMGLMKSAGVRHLPVVEGTTFYGLISIRDLITQKAQEDRETIQFLTDYLFYVPPEQ